MELYDLQRFIAAQDLYDSYNTALQEVNSGWKQSHWMWYVFPQIHGLGHSETSKKYSIKSLLEAKAYTENEVLNDRLREITNALLNQENSAEDIFGQLDALKLRSCMTLFDLVSPDDIYADVLENFFNKERCQPTLKILDAELTYYKGETAFRRNGISISPKAFFESGSYESNEITYEQAIGTLFDLMQRGESMRMLSQRYLWDKDFLTYRVSGIQTTLLSYLRNIYQEISDKTSDDELFKEMNRQYNHLCSSDSNIFVISEAIDDFWKLYKNDKRVKPVIETYVKESLCKPINNAKQRLYKGIVRPDYTPDALSSLRKDEVFVFGSNLAGHHAGGAARAALNKFGAIWGQGIGIQGQSYAIPTMQGGAETIKPYVDQFVDFAKNHKEMFFYVTRIGCGIAGFKDKDIAPLFIDAIHEENICLPKSFAEIIEPSVPDELLTMMYGQMRTLIDLLKELNKQEPIKDSDDAMKRLKELIGRNVRYGDEEAFMAMRTIWCLTSQYEQEGKPVDIEKLEKDMLSFHDKNTYFKEMSIDKIFYNYSVRKMIKYIQFLNDFRRYTSYEKICEDLRTIPVSHCSENDPKYYYSFFPPTVYKVWTILYEEWENITRDGVLNNDALEDVAFGRFDKMVAQNGLRETIDMAYGDIGCHPDLKGPKPKKNGTVWGPYYRIEGERIEKGCSDFRRWPWSNMSFEMMFAHTILDEDENYVKIETDWGGGLYIPRSDFSLPVYVRYHGKKHFNTEEDKVEFIKKYLPKQYADKV